MNFHPFYIWWWRMILTKPAYGISWLTAIICRIRNHPCGVIWYNASGLEPDMRCKNCEDYLN